MPQIKNMNIQLSFLDNSIYSYIFTFKLFTYIYNPIEHQFTSYKFSLNFLTKEEIHIKMKIHNIYNFLIFLNSIIIYLINILMIILNNIC